MSTHLIAYFENVNNVTDSEINVVGDDVLSQPTAERFTVPFDYNNVHWAMLLADNITRGRLVAPSLEVRRTRPTIVPHARDAAPSLTVPKVYKPVRPIELIPSEELSVRVTNPTAGEDTWALVLLGKKDKGQLPAGDIRRIRCTASTALTDSAWSTVTVVPDEQLDAGQYELVNFTAWSATIIACRALIQGQAYRPGVIGMPGASEQVAMDFADSWGRIHDYYPMGRFPHNVLPRFQFLAGAADAAETVYMDVVKVG